MASSKPAPNNALGSGPVSIGNATWNSTSAAQTFGNTVTLTDSVTFDTTTDLTIGGLAGSGTFSKVGGGTLGIAGIGSDTGNINITAGTVRMDNMGALGGNATAGVTPPLAITNASLVFNATGNGTTGVRPSAGVQLNSSTMMRNQLTPGLGPSPTNGDSELAYPNDQYTGGAFTVTGNSTITNLETRTAATSDTPGSGGSSNEIIIRMPMVISTGATLTLDPVNNAISTLNGIPTGDLSNTGIALRGPTFQGPNDNDSVTLQAGSTLVMTGASEKRIGTKLDRQAHHRLWHARLRSRHQGRRAHLHDRRRHRGQQHHADRLGHRLGWSAHRSPDERDVQQRHPHLHIRLARNQSRYVHHDRG